MDIKLRNATKQRRWLGDLPQRRVAKFVNPSAAVSLRTGRQKSENKTIKGKNVKLTWIELPQHQTSWNSCQDPGKSYQELWEIPSGSCKLLQNPGRKSMKFLKWVSECEQLLKKGPRANDIKNI